MSFNGCFSCILLSFGIGRDLLFSWLLFLLLLSWLFVFVFVFLHITFARPTYWEMTRDFCMLRVDTNWRTSRTLARPDICKRHPIAKKQPSRFLFARSLVA
jgi:hypothetical protein